MECGMLQKAVNSIKFSILIVVQWNLSWHRMLNDPSESQFHTVLEHCKEESNSLCLILGRVLTN
jgi:hypothetical protein